MCGALLCGTVFPGGVSRQPERSENVKTQKKRVRKWTTQTAYTRHITVRLPLTLADQLKDYADRHEMTVTDAVKWSVIEYLSENDE